MLEPGMVITLESSLALTDRGGLARRLMVHEENVVVTATGCELLTRRAPPELPIVRAPAGNRRRTARRVVGFWIPAAPVSRSMRGVSGPSGTRVDRGPGERPAAGRRHRGVGNTSKRAPVLLTAARAAPSIGRPVPPPLY